VRARMEKENGGYAVAFGGTRIPLSQEALGEAKERGQEPERLAGKEVVLGIRPEHMEDAGTEEAEALGGAEGSSYIDVETQVIESMGSEKYVYFDIGGEHRVTVASLAAMTDDTGGGEEEDTGGESAEDVSGDLMVARISAESTAKEGTEMRLVIDSTKIRLFDPESEEAIL
jgi:multiple sugar transport system ATP-binding protein